MSDDYLRHPAVAGDRVFLVADDDVWMVDLDGGGGQRLTDGRTPASHPLPSPGDRWLAFTAREEDHPEVFRMPLDGGVAERWTHLGGSVCVPRAWKDAETLVVATNGGLPFARDSQLVAVGGPTEEPLGLGSAHEVALGAGGTVLLGRNTTNQGRWKRYRGGTAGHLWVDADGAGTFRRLLPDLQGDVSSPMLVGSRAWFISDHEGVGNLYSCPLDGSDLTRHTHHEDFYARFAHTDGRTIVYVAGGDLWRLDPRSGTTSRVPVRLRAARTQRSRRFVDPNRWIQSYAVHPKGTHVAVRVRGRPFTMPLYEGPVTQHGTRDGVNHRLVTWMSDGERVVMLADTEGEERLEVHGPDGLAHRVPDIDLGVVMHLAVNPREDLVAITDMSGRLRIVDLATDEVTEVARSPFGVDHPAWSPDGAWLAWSHRETNWHTASIRLYERAADTATMVTDARFANRTPAWDPSGRFLYWISSSRLAPVPDGAYSDHAFPFPDVVMAAVLQADGSWPLQVPPHPPGRPPRKTTSTPSKPAADPPDPAAGSGHANEGDDADEADGDAEEEQPDTTEGGAEGEGEQPSIRIDVDGLPQRVTRLPFPTGRYRGVTGLRGKVLAFGVPLRPDPLMPKPAKDRRPQGQLELLSLVTGKHEVLIGGITSYAVSADAQTLVYAVRRRLRAVRAGSKPPEGPAAEGHARVSGWLDLSRVAVSVSPPEEWRQIFDEAWRLQRELFWHTDMSGVDWEAIRERYRHLIDRIASRAELSDLIWEMFGELGTGHAYERGGDHPSAPRAPLGRLGADLRFDGAEWIVDRVLEGDPTHPRRRMPLRAPGVGVSAGARILAVDGVAVDAETSPASLLVNRADTEVRLRVREGDASQARTVTVHTLAGDVDLRYGDWVARNRARVAQRSDGRVGYVHIPDMGPGGFSEFHRQYLAEVHADALVIDVRFNGGGNVSSLLLEKLAGVRIGYQLRRTGALEPYPHHAPAGPLVAVTNERCGSDGDIFTHAWKRLDLGPVVGTRTWGGVIGIQPRLASVDGTVTTQPGFAFWFDDVGFGVENYGTDPTHPTEIAPHDAAAGRDPQLDRAVDLALEALAQHPPPPRPDPAEAPDLSPPRLPD